MEEKRTRHAIHITHNDADAVGCALVANVMYPDTDISKNTYFCSIGTQDDVLNDALEDYASRGEVLSLIVISDISLSVENCERLTKIAETGITEVVGYDHHVTNCLNEKFPWFNVFSGKVPKTWPIDDIETTISAAEIMLSRAALDINKVSVLSALIYMISRYDTWTWKKYPYDWSEHYPNMSDDLIATICHMIGADECYKQLAPLYKPNCVGEIKATFDHMVPEHFHTLYKTMKTKEDYAIKSAMKKVHVVKMSDGDTIALFPSENEHSNAIAEYVYSNYESIDIVVVLYVSSSKIGLRCREGHRDVSKIAGCFGGGGHPSAAGCTLSRAAMLAALSIYQVRSTTLENYSLRVDENTGEDVNEE